MPESERSEERLAKEAQVLLGGGTASTARTIGFASYYILSRPHIQSRLAEELDSVMGTWPQQIPTWAELEKLPYLQAVLKESLRYTCDPRHVRENGSAHETPQSKLWSDAQAAPCVTRRRSPI